MRRNTGKEPQAALSRRKLADIVRASTDMRNRQIRMAKQPFTLHELMHLFVDPTHHDHLRYVYDLVEPSGMTSTLFVKADTPAHLQQHASRDNHLKFSWYGRQEAGFYVPCEWGSEERYAVGVHPSAPAEMVEKFRQVEADLLDIQCRFALVERVLRQLNDPQVCRTLPQIRYYWPAIIILLNRSDHKDDAKLVAEPSVRAGDKVVMPPQLGGWLKETNDTIVRALMLDDVELPPDRLPVDYYLDDTFRISS